MTPTHSSIEEVVEEFDRKFAHATYSPDGYGGAECHCNEMKDFLRTKLTTLVAEAEARGYNDGYGECDAENEFEYKRGLNDGLKKAFQLVDEHDPNVGMGRDTSPAYWGNTLRKALQALTNHRV